MKKIIVGILVAMAFVFVFGFTGCFGDGGNSSKNKTVEIVVHNDSSTKNYTVTLGKTAKIDAVYKNGYYPLGFFTQAEGGDKYFDFAGDSVSIWQEDYPTEFYAQYDSIENFDAIEWDYGSAEKSCKYGYYEPSVSENEQAYYALMGNLDKTLEIHLSFRLMMTNSTTSNHYVRFYNKTGNTQELFAQSPQFVTTGKDWHDFEFTLECPAKIFSDDMKIAIQITSTNDGLSTCYAKEFVMSVKFSVEEN